MPDQPNTPAATSPPGHDHKAKEGQPMNVTEIIEIVVVVLRIVSALLDR